MNKKHVSFKWTEFKKSIVFRMNINETWYLRWISRVTQPSWNATRTHTLKHKPCTQHEDHHRVRVLRSLKFPRLQNTKRLGAEGQKNIVWVSFLSPNGPWEAALSEANRPPSMEGERRSGHQGSSSPHGLLCNCIPEPQTNWRRHRLVLLRVTKNRVLLFDKRRGYRNVMFGVYFTPPGRAGTHNLSHIPTPLQETRDINPSAVLSLAIIIPTEAIINYG